MNGLRTWLGILILSCGGFTFAGEMEIVGNPVRLWPPGGSVPLEHRVNFVFLSEGFTTAGDLSDYADEVDRMTEEIFTHQPFRDCKDDITVWRIDVLSQESLPYWTWNGKGLFPGENTSNTTLVSKQRQGDTAFDCARVMSGYDEFIMYKYGADWRRRVAGTPDNYDLALRRIPGLTRSHRIVPIVLADGGARAGGLCYPKLEDYWQGAITASSSASKQVMIHEIGHSIGELNEEYGVGGGDALKTLRDLLVTNGRDCPIPNYSFYAESVEAGGKWEGYQFAMGVKPVRFSEMSGGSLNKLVFAPSFRCAMNNAYWYTNASTAYCPICLRAVRGVIDQTAGRTTQNTPPQPVNAPALTLLELVPYQNGSPLTPIPITDGTHVTTLSAGQRFRFRMSATDSDAGRTGKPHSLKFIGVISTEACNGLDPFRVSNPAHFQIGWRTGQSDTTLTVEASDWDHFLSYETADTYGARIRVMDSGGLLSDPVEFTVIVSPN